MNTLSVSLEPESAYFEGHFEGNPVLPAVAHLALVEAAINKVGLDVEIAGVEFARFRLPVLPGETLTVSFPNAPREGLLRFEIERTGDSVTQGVLRVR